MIDAHLSIDRISINMVGKQTQRITVHIEAVALRIVYGHGPICRHGMTSHFVVEAVVACQHIAVYGVVHHHMTKGLTKALFSIIEEAVASESFALIGQDGAVKQFSLFGDCVINSTLRIDMILITHDIRRAKDGCHLSQRTIFKRI